MKIAITGAMGVGKTTLAKQIVDESGKKLSEGYTLLPEVARLMIAEGFDLDAKATPDIEREMLKRQLSLEKLPGNIIMDRCVIDILAYSMHLFWNDLKLIKEIERKIKKDSYDIIFHLEPEFPIEEDGVRSTDTKLQKRIDSNIKRILHLHDLNYHKITGTREERLSQVIKHLTSMK